MTSTSLREKYSNYYRYCIVRDCKNTTIKTPGKLWIRVPSATNKRNTWLRLAQRDPESLSTGSSIYFCEDHFDLETDMENYIRYRVMGSVKKVLMKPDCVPSKFPSQQSNKNEIKSSTLDQPEDKDKKKGIEKKKRFAVCPMETSTSSFFKPAASSSTLIGSQSDPKSNMAVIFLKECERDAGSEDTQTKALEQEALDDPEITKIKDEHVLYGRPRCSECFKVISGFVFACVPCGARACGACDARHQRHYVLRAPAVAPANELESMIRKLRSPHPPPPHLPPDPAPPLRDPPQMDLEVDTEPQYEVIKMEIKEEEEEVYQPVLSHTTSASAADQLLQKDPLDPNGETVRLADPEDEDSVSSSSSTITASESSLSDSEQDEDSIKQSKIIWTNQMNRHLFRLHTLMSRTEKNRSALFSRIKQAFTRIFPHIKVTNSKLEAQFETIHKKLLRTKDLADIEFQKQNMRFGQLKKAIESEKMKGANLVLSKVTSGNRAVNPSSSRNRLVTSSVSGNSAMNTSSNQKRLPSSDKGKTKNNAMPSTCKSQLITSNSGVKTGKCPSTSRRKFKSVRDYREMIEMAKGKTLRKGKKSQNKKFLQAVQPSEPVSLPPGRSGRARKLPVRFSNHSLVVKKV